MEGTVKLKDIAANLGLSIGTVQRALNNKGGYSAATQKRVIEEARRLDYQVNTAASSLRRNPMTIAAVLPRAERENRYFFRFVWKGIEKALDDLSFYNVTLERYYAEPGSTVALSIFSDILDSEDVKGVVTYTTGTREEEDAIRRFMERGIPVYVINASALEKESAGIMEEHTPGIGKVAADMMEVSCKDSSGQVLILGGPRKSLKHRERVDEFTSEMYSRCPGIMMTEMHLYDDLDTLARQLDDMLVSKGRLIGIFAVSSRETLRMCEAVGKAGLSGKLVTVGVDVFPELLPYFQDGTLTASVYQYPAQRVYVGMKNLVDAIDSASLERRKMTFPIGTVFRSNALSYADPESFFWK